MVGVEGGGSSGDGERWTSSRAPFIARVASASALVGGVGFGWLATGCRVFLLSIFPDLTFRLGGIAVQTMKKTLESTPDCGNNAGWVVEYAEA